MRLEGVKRQALDCLLRLVFEPSVATILERYAHGFELNCVRKLSVSAVWFELAAECRSLNSNNF